MSDRSRGGTATLMREEVLLMVIRQPSWMCETANGKRTNYELTSQKKGKGEVSPAREIAAEGRGPIEAGIESAACG